MVGHSGQERRRFFRITDQVALTFRLKTEDSEPGALKGAQPAADILALEQQIQAAIERLRGTGEAAVPVLELMNQKINRLWNLPLANDSPVAEPSAIDVSLSACGIAFPTDHYVEIGAELDMSITLMPEHVRLRLEGVVVNRDEFGDDYALDKVLDTTGSLAAENATDSPSGAPANYLLRVDFTELREDDQEVLIQHVLRCQTRALKQRRESQK